MTLKKTGMIPRHQMGTYQSESLEKTTGGYEKGMKAKRKTCCFLLTFDVSPQLLGGILHQITVGTRQLALEVDGVDVVEQIRLPFRLSSTAHWALDKHRPHNAQLLLDGLQVIPGWAPQRGIVNQVIDSPGGRDLKAHSLRMLGYSPHILNKRCLLISFVFD